MNNAIAEKPSAKAQRRNVITPIASLRGQMYGLNDYLDLREARARNKGKRTCTIDEVRKQIGLS